MIFTRTRMFMAFSTTLVIAQHEYLQVSQNTFLYKIWVLVHFCKPVRKRVPWTVRNQDVDNPRQAKTRKVSVPISSQMERSSGGICGGNNMLQWSLWDYQMFEFPTLDPKRPPNFCGMSLIFAYKTQDFEFWIQKTRCLKRNLKRMHPEKGRLKNWTPPKKTGKVRPPFHLFNFWSSKDDNFFGVNTKSIQQRDVWWVVRDTDILTMEMMTSQGHLFHLSNLWLLNAFSWL